MIIPPWRHSVRVAAILFLLLAVLSGHLSSVNAACKANSIFPSKRLSMYTYSSNLLQRNEKKINRACSSGEDDCDMAFNGNSRDGQWTPSETDKRPWVNFTLTNENDTLSNMYLGRVLCDVCQYSENQLVELQINNVVPPITTPIYLDPFDVKEEGWYRFDLPPTDKITTFKLTLPEHRAEGAAEFQEIELHRYNNLKFSDFYLDFCDMRAPSVGVPVEPLFQEFQQHQITYTYTKSFKEDVKIDEGQVLVMCRVMVTKCDEEQISGRPGELRVQVAVMQVDGQTQLIMDQTATVSSLGDNEFGGVMVQQVNRIPRVSTVIYNVTFSPEDGDPKIKTHLEVMFDKGEFERVNIRELNCAISATDDHSQDEDTHITEDASCLKILDGKPDTYINLQPDQTVSFLFDNLIDLRRIRFDQMDVSVMEVTKYFYKDGASEVSEECSMFPVWEMPHPSAMRWLSMQDTQSGVSVVVIRQGDGDSEQVWRLFDIEFYEMPSKITTPSTTTTTTTTPAHPSTTTPISTSTSETTSASTLPPTSTTSVPTISTVTPATVTSPTSSDPVTTPATPAPVTSTTSQSVTTSESTSPSSEETKPQTSPTSDTTVSTISTTVSPKSTVSTTSDSPMTTESTSSNSPVTPVSTSSNSPVTPVSTSSNSPVTTVSTTDSTKPATSATTLNSTSLTMSTVSPTSDTPVTDPTPETTPTPATDPTEETTTRTLTPGTVTTTVMTSGSGSTTTTTTTTPVTSTSSTTDEFTDTTASTVTNNRSTVTKPTDPLTSTTTGVSPDTDTTTTPLSMTTSDVTEPPDNVTDATTSKSTPTQVPSTTTTENTTTTTKNTATTSSTIDYTATTTKTTTENTATTTTNTVTTPSPIYNTTTTSPMTTTKNTATTSSTTTTKNTATTLSPTDNTGTTTSRTTTENTATTSTTTAVTPPTIFTTPTGATTSTLPTVSTTSSLTTMTSLGTTLQRTTSTLPTPRTTSTASSPTTSTEPPVTTASAVRPPVTQTHFEGAKLSYNDFSLKVLGVTFDEDMKNTSDPTYWWTYDEFCVLLEKAINITFGEDRYIGPVYNVTFENGSIVMRNKFDVKDQTTVNNSLFTSNIIGQFNSSGYKVTDINIGIPLSYKAVQDVLMVALVCSVACIVVITVIVTVFCVRRRMQRREERRSQSQHMTGPRDRKEYGEDSLDSGLPPWSPFTPQGMDSRMWQRNDGLTGPAWSSEMALVAPPALFSHPRHSGTSMDSETADPGYFSYPQLLDQAVGLGSGGYSLPNLDMDYWGARPDRRSAPSVVEGFDPPPLPPSNNVRPRKPYQRQYSSDSRHTEYSRASPSTQDSNPDPPSPDLSPWVPSVHMAGPSSRPAANTYRERLPTSHSADISLEEDNMMFTSPVHLDPSVASLATQDSFVSSDSDNVIEQGGAVGGGIGIGIAPGESNPDVVLPKFYRNRDDDAYSGYFISRDLSGSPPASAHDAFEMPSGFTAAAADMDQGSGLHRSGADPVDDLDPQNPPFSIANVGLYSEVQTSSSDDLSGSLSDNFSGYNELTPYDSGYDDALKMYYHDPKLDDRPLRLKILQTLGRNKRPDKLHREWPAYLVASGKKMNTNSSKVKQTL